MVLPRQSIIITPSTPLCEDIRAIVSSISATVDESTPSCELILLLGVLCVVYLRFSLREANEKSQGRKQNPLVSH